MADDRSEVERLIAEDAYEAQLIHGVSRPGDPEPVGLIFGGVGVDNLVYTLARSGQLNIRRKKDGRWLVQFDTKDMAQVAVGVSHSYDAALCMVYDEWQALPVKALDVGTPSWVSVRIWKLPDNERERQRCHCYHVDPNSLPGHGGPGSYLMAPDPDEP